MARIIFMSACLVSLSLTPNAWAQTSNVEHAAPVSPSTGETAKGADVKGDSDKRAGEILRKMFPQSVKVMESSTPSKSFGGEFAHLAYENAYVSLWARPGLSPRDRSILTIGILIGMRNETELRAHFAGALNNGITPQELEEMIYHATAYAGFPAASSALAVAKQAIEQQQHK